MASNHFPVTIPTLMTQSPEDATNPPSPSAFAASAATAPEAVFSTGYAALDAVLPGGGWPAAALTELLLAQPGKGELRLLAPALQRITAQGGELLCFDPPLLLNAWALQALGVPARQLLLVRPRGAALAVAAARHATKQGPAAKDVQDVLWALEQTLRSSHRGAVLAWLPARLPGGTMPLRRLQLAAQTHPGPVFLFRDDAAAAGASPAPLRLHLASAGADALQVRVLKRRGAPLAQPLVLQLPPVLAPTALARARARPVAAAEEAALPSAAARADGPPRALTATRATSTTGATSGATSGATATKGP